MTKTDESAVAAVDAARAALLEQVGESVVGEYLEAVTEDDGVVTEYFACTQTGYPGWRWAVTVVRAAGEDAVTIDEVVLLPGPDSIVAPAWIP